MNDKGSLGNKATEKSLKTVWIECRGDVAVPGLVSTLGLQTLAAEFCWILLLKWIGPVA